MKSKIKRILSALLTLTLILSVFAGCSETSSNNNDLNSNEKHSSNELMQVDSNHWLLNQ